MNNATKGCPAQMSDGRMFTDYRPSGDVYDMMIKKAIKEGIANNYQYRQFCIHNAEQKITNTQNTLLNTKLCKQCTLEGYIKEFN